MAELVEELVVFIVELIDGVVVSEAVIETGAAVIDGLEDAGIAIESEADPLMNDISDLQQELKANPDNAEVELEIEAKQKQLGQLFKEKLGTRSDEIMKLAKENTAIESKISKGKFTYKGKTAGLKTLKTNRLRIKNLLEVGTTTVPSLIPGAAAQETLFSISESASSLESAMSDVSFTAEESSAMSDSEISEDIFKAAKRRNIPVEDVKGFFETNAEKAKELFANFKGATVAKVNEIFGEITGGKVLLAGATAAGGGMMIKQLVDAANVPELKDLIPENLKDLSVDKIKEIFDKVEERKKKLQDHEVSVVQKVGDTIVNVINKHQELLPKGKLLTKAAKGAFDVVSAVSELFPDNPVLKLINGAMDEGKEFFKEHALLGSIATNIKEVLLEEKSLGDAIVDTGKEIFGIPAGTAASSSLKAKKRQLEKKLREKKRELAKLEKAAEKVVGELDEKVKKSQMSDHDKAKVDKSGVSLKSGKKKIVINISTCCK